MSNIRAASTKGAGIRFAEQGKDMKTSAQKREDRKPGGDGGGLFRRPDSARPDSARVAMVEKSVPARPTPPTDEQLLQDYRLGDRASFAKLVERYQRELYHFLVRFLGDRAAAEDVFQETFLQVHQSAKLFDPQRRFKPWLFTIAANKARDLIRAQARRPANPLQASINKSDDDGGEFIDLMQMNQPAPDEPMRRRELAQMVQKTVMEMPDNLREVLLLSYFHQFPYKQISGILGIPLGTVKSRLHAAVAYFADRWKQANHGPAES
jgi:RNA polymerase sigma-70 factor (ECF subfamily)